MGSGPKCRRKGRRFRPANSQHSCVDRRGRALAKNIVVQEKLKADRSWWSLHPSLNGTPSGVDPPPSGSTTHSTASSSRSSLPTTCSQTASRSPNPIRRVTYDLTGLPPSTSKRSRRSDKIVARRLRKARRSSARFAALRRALGSALARCGPFRRKHGYEVNISSTNVWPFRDYVIESINGDKPFDQLITEHLAGDVVGAGDPTVEVGLAFLVAARYDDVGNMRCREGGAIRADMHDEMVRATGEAFLVSRRLRPVPRS